MVTPGYEGRLCRLVGLAQAKGGREIHIQKYNRLQKKSQTHGPERSSVWHARKAFPFMRLARQDSIEEFDLELVFSNAAWRHTE